MSDMQQIIFVGFWICVAAGLWLYRPKSQPFISSFDIVSMMVISERKSGRPK